MNSLYAWAAKWGVPLPALLELQQAFGTLPPESRGRPAIKRSEAAVQAAIRLEAGRKGVRLFRNNVGALKDEGGRVVRYGLANDSAQLNKEVKSADLIGVRPVLITPAHVGHTVGQFVSRECKEGGWSYSGTPRELAQLKWIEVLAALGADACFASSEGTL